MKSSRYSLSMFLAISMFCPLVAAQQGATTSSSAAVPRLVNFSGKAADAQGKPISGIAGVTFGVYKDQYEGAPLWMETQNVHPDASGNYTAQLGATKSEGMPLELFTAPEPRWLGVHIDGGEDQPRVLLVSVPYALKAADAQTLGGLPASAFTLAAPPAASGSNASPQQPLAAAEQSNEVVCSSTTACKTGFIPAFSSNGGSAKITDSIISQSGTTVTVAGNEAVARLAASGTITASTVGIGTATPATELDVFSATAGIHDPIARFGSTGATDANAIKVYTGALSGNAITEVFTSGGPNLFVPGTRAGDGGLRVYPGADIFFGDSATRRMSIFANGDVFQPSTAGGFVKAMVYLTGFRGNNGIVSCFNSQNPGNLVFCGFTMTKLAVGVYLIDFGFQVDNRFFSSMATNTGGTTVAVCTGITFGGSCANSSPTANQVEITYSAPGIGNFDGLLYLIVF